ncbi:MAG: hypothetical protein IJZ45_04975 [Bacteroidaceae bacterium]|nr:hypothetical protein [Bacteroidaceae bacterium]
MKKFKNYLFQTICLTVLGFSLFACSEDDEGASLSGIYLTPANTGWGHPCCQGLYFINGNTVKVYDYLFNYEHWGDASVYFGQYNNSLWFFQEDCDVNATYSVIDNKVYIPSEGMILTIEGDLLVPEGSSSSQGFKKVKKSSGSTSEVQSLSGEEIVFVRRGVSNDYPLVETVTFKFTDSANCTYTVHTSWYDGPFFDDKYRPNGYYKEQTRVVSDKGTYVCSGNVVQITLDYYANSVLKKVNGTWVWEGSEDFINQ